MEAPSVKDNAAQGTVTNRQYSGRRSGGEVELGIGRGKDGGNNEESR